MKALQMFTLFYVLLLCVKKGKKKRQESHWTWRSFEFIICRWTGQKFIIGWLNTKIRPMWLLPLAFIFFFCIFANIKSIYIRDGGGCQMLQEILDYLYTSCRAKKCKLSFKKKLHAFNGRYEWVNKTFKVCIREFCGN